MRTRPSGVDKDITIYEFAFGKEELKLLLGIAHTTKNHLPSGIGKIPMLGRLSNIIREFERILREEKK